MNGYRTPIARAAVVLALIAALAWAAPPEASGETIPSVMNYQGRLTDNTPQQTPIHTSLPMGFAIYDTSLGGAPLWSETWPAVTVVNGIFSILLGSSGSPIPASVFTGGTSRYLEITVNGEILAPRQQLGATGWAARAETAAGTDCDGCIGSSQIGDASIAGADIAPEAIGSAQLASGAVGTSELAAGAVDGSRIAANAVTETHLAANAVGASEIATDAVGAPEIASDAVGNAELNNAEQFTFNGGMILEASGAEFITRNAGATKLELWSDSGISYFYHRPAGSYLLVSDATGNWGIDTTSPQDRFHVAGSVRANALVDGNNPAFFVDPASTSSLATVDVSGTTYLGWQIVSLIYDLSTAVSSCHSHGNLPCYTGSACVACPAGTVVLGGGCNAAGARFGSISRSYPSGNTSWCCDSSYDISGSADTAYAICARVAN